jgi:hypothetical protein
MAKEAKKPGKGSEKAERSKPVGDNRKQIRNHESRPGSVVEKAKKQIRNHESRPDNVVKKE